MTKKVLVTGITGQDGAYLASLLLEKGCKVYGACRQLNATHWRLNELGINQHPDLVLIEHDLVNASASIQLLDTIQPDAVYNFAAQSNAHLSFSEPLTTALVTGMSPIYLLEAIRTVNSGIRFCQASSAEMFGHPMTTPQTELTSFQPLSPYGMAKLYAHNMAVAYRNSHGIFAASSILFNHESPLRGREFVTRKITTGVANLVREKGDVLMLGNLDAKRDWGFAKEYVEGMYRMMQQPTSDTYVLATQRIETVRQFVVLAFRAVDIELEWRGDGVEERGLDRKTGKVLVKVSPEFYRPDELHILIGDATKARNQLGWAPKTSLEELCRMMVEAELSR